MIQTKARIFKLKNSSNSNLVFILVWKWITSVLNKDNFCKGFSYFLSHTNILMIFFWWEPNSHSKKLLTIFESGFFLIQFFLISKFQESFMTYKWDVMYIIYRTKLLFIVVNLQLVGMIWNYNHFFKLNIEQHFGLWHWIVHPSLNIR